MTFRTLLTALLSKYPQVIKQKIPQKKMDSMLLMALALFGQKKLATLPALG